MKDKFLTVVRYSIIISFLCWFISGATYHIFCKTEIKQKQDSMIHILTTMKELNKYDIQDIHPGKSRALFSQRIIACFFTNEDNEVVANELEKNLSNNQWYVRIYRYENDEISLTAKKNGYIIFIETIKDKSDYNWSISIMEDDFFNRFNL